MDGALGRIRTCNLLIRSYVSDNALTSKNSLRPVQRPTMPRFADYNEILRAAEAQCRLVSGPPSRAPKSVAGSVASGQTPYPRPRLDHASVGVGLVRRRAGRCRGGWRMPARDAVAVRDVGNRTLLHLIGAVVTSRRPAKDNGVRWRAALLAALAVVMTPAVPAPPPPGGSAGDGRFGCVRHGLRPTRRRRAKVPASVKQAASSSW